MTNQRVAGFSLVDQWKAWERKQPTLRSIIGQEEAQLAKAVRPFWQCVVIVVAFNVAPIALFVVGTVQSPGLKNQLGVSATWAILAIATVCLLPGLSTLCSPIDRAENWLLGSETFEVQCWVAWLEQHAYPVVNGISIVMLILAATLR